MPTIPRYHTQIQPTSTSMPRTPLNMSGPSPFVGLGIALTEFGLQIDKARKSSQLAKAQTAWKEGIADFGSSLEGDTKYETYEKRFDLYTKNLYKSISSQINHGGASGVFELWTRDSLVVEKTKVRHRANQLEARFMEADYFKHLTLAVKREDRSFIIDETQNAIEAGYVDPVVAGKAKEKALEELDWTTAWNDIINVRDRDEVLVILNNTELSLTKKNTLISNWKREQVAKSAKTAENQAIKEEEARAAILPRLQDGTITAAEIGVSALDTEEKYKWQERLHKRNKRVADGKDNPFNILDPAVDVQVMKAIYSDDPPTEKEIRGRVGAGLTIARAEHWIAKLNKPDRGYKRALEYFQGQIMPRQALTVGESSPNAASYWQAVVVFDEYLETDKGQTLSGNELLQKAMEMAPDYVLTIEEQVEAAKKKWGVDKKLEPERGWWEKTKDWISSDEEETPPEIKIEIKQEITDEEIKKLLDDYGYTSTPKDIITFRKNNG